MYTDDDLKQAVEEGIFTAPAVEQFRGYIMQRDNTYVADEENFKLINSFNDIFVVLACALLLISVGSVTSGVHHSLATAVVAVLSWLLAEFFVLRRKMALPAIVLLASFVGSVFATVIIAYPDQISEEFPMLLAAFAATVAAWFHWKRFHVPITVAAGASSAALFIVTLIVSLLPLSVSASMMMPLTFISGVVIFLLAMRWDMADRKRVTGKSDVAFWLHLAAAPMIVHPVFSSLGILEGTENSISLLIVLLLYVVVTILSLVVDRRVFMVSSLVYVLVALTQLLKKYGIETDNLAYVCVFIGLSLLLLSGFWHKVRRAVVNVMPQTIQLAVPPAM